MRQGGKMLATVLDYLKRHVSAGMTSKDLAEIAARELKALGGKPAFLGYYGFPDVLCVSVGDEVVHGIPDKRHILSEGDVVSLDFGVDYQDLITDGAITVVLGQPSKDISRLVESTLASLEAGIEAVKGNCRVGDISSAVQKILEENKLGIIRDLVGHGVGHNLHEEPNIPNYGKKGTGPLLQPGMTIAIEPMATLGTYRVVIEDDGWTVRSADGSTAAHFEHTVLITDNGAEILTKL
jgi:methionyl aminopeptidase